MPVIILHSSKTMRSVENSKAPGNQSPLLLQEASQLATRLKTLSSEELQKAMTLSPAMADKTHRLISKYQPGAKQTLPALDIFLGDIFSGLQVQTFSEHDRIYANKHLFILSGLYGVLRALDEIQPYRLEMGYKLPGHPPISLYEFWGDKIAQTLPKNELVVNLSAKEYTRAIFPHFKNIDGLKDSIIISPKFLTISPKSNQPVFVTVHAKVARGAFARWLIQGRIDNLDQIKDFSELGYEYNPNLSTADEPVFVAKEFKGIGLSVRLS